MPIPATKPAPITDLHRQITLLYGPPKAGKSTIAAAFPDSIFLATEAGLNSLDAMRWVRDATKPANDPANYVTRTWDELLAAANEIITGKTHKTIIIDTIGNACAMADRHVCEKYGEDYRGSGDLSFGKGGAMIIGELSRFLRGLARSGMGVVMIAHSYQKEVDTAAGKLTKTVPHIPGDTKKDELYTLLLGTCDIVLFMDMMPDGSRVIRTKPKATYEAGDRTGRLPDTLPATYAALSGAFVPAKPAQVAATK